MTKDEIFEEYERRIKAALALKNKESAPLNYKLERIHSNYIEAFVAASRWAEAEERKL